MKDLKQLKENVKREVANLGKLAEAGIRASDFARYDAQQQKVADAKRALRIALGIEASR